MEKVSNAPGTACMHEAAQEATTAAGAAQESTTAAGAAQEATTAAGAAPSGTAMSHCGTITKNNLGECSICFTIFDGSGRRPRTLPCGHTFCTPCIDDIIEAGQLSCPSCRAHHLATSAIQFPISYFIEDLVKQLQAMKFGQTSVFQDVPGRKPALAETAAGSGLRVESVGTTYQQQSTDIGRKLQSLLEEQKNIVCSVVAGNQDVQSQLDQYRAQLAEWKTQHLHHLDRLYSLVEKNKVVVELLEQEDTRVLDMKKEAENGEKQLEAVLGSLATVNTACQVGPTIETADHYTVEAEDWMQKCQECFPDVNTVNTSMKVWDVTQRVLETETAETGATEDPTQLEDSTLPLQEKINLISQVSSTEDLWKMRPLVKRLVETGLVFGVQKDQRGLRSSRITIDNRGLYLHCLLDQPPPPHARTLPVSEMVGALDPSSTLVFLEMSWPGSTRRRVHIRLSPDTPRAREFVLLCTAQRGHSYLNTALHYVVDKGKPGEVVIGGDYEYNNDMGEAQLLTHPKHEYRKSSSAGSVLLGFETTKGNFQFAITTRNSMDGKRYCNVIGEVESGLEVVRAAVNHSNITKMTVMDCGIVVPL